MAWATRSPCRVSSRPLSRRSRATSGSGSLSAQTLVAGVARLLAGDDEREHRGVDGLGQRHRVPLLQFGRRLELGPLLDRDRAARCGGRARAPPCRCGAGAPRPRRCRCGRRGGCRSPRRCTPACTSAPSPGRRAARVRPGPVTRWRNRVRRSCAQRRPIPSRACRSTTHRRRPRRHHHHRPPGPAQRPRPRALRRARRRVEALPRRSRRVGGGGHRGRRRLLRRR